MSEQDGLSETALANPEFTINQAVDDIAHEQGLEVDGKEPRAEPEDKGAESKPAPEKESKEPPADTRPEAAPASAEAPVPPAPAPETAPPDTWTAAAKAKWGDVPSELRAEILKREGDMQKGLQQYSDKARLADTFTEMVKPFIPVYQKMGVNAQQLIPAVLQAHAVMAWGTPEQKVHMFRELAKDVGVDLSKITSDPLNAVNPKIDQLEQRVSQLTAAQQQAFNAAREVQISNMEKDVLAFANDPKNLYFNDVADSMRLLLDRGVARDLKDAYEQAVYLNPITRAKEIDRLSADRQSKEAKEAADKAAKARKAVGANVRSSEQGGAAPGKLGTIDDTLKETLAEINARG